MIYSTCCTFFLQDYINGLPNVDNPEVFGQHSNADIASQIRETRYTMLMGGRMDGWTDGWMDGRMDRLTDGQRDGCTVLKLE